MRDYCTKNRMCVSVTFFRLILINFLYKIISDNKTWTGKKILIKYARRLDLTRKNYISNHKTKIIENYCLSFLLSFFFRSE